MLQTIGVDTMEQLIYETIPSDIRLDKDIQLDNAMSEQEYLEHINELALHNKVFKSYIGLGSLNSIYWSII